MPEAISPISMLPAALDAFGATEMNRSLNWSILCHRDLLSSS